MSRRIVASLTVLVALFLGPTAGAIEPDGRVAFRYDWPDQPNGAVDGGKLRLSITPVVAFADARLLAAVPTGVAMTVQTPGPGPTPWPETGLKLGDLAAGQTVVVELDVVRPPTGGGIVGFVLQGTCDGKPVREAVGVTVGLVGTPPTLRSGAAEFPAARPDPAP